MLVTTLAPKVDRGRKKKNKRGKMRQIQFEFPISFEVRFLITVFWVCLGTQMLRSSVKPQG